MRGRDTAPGEAALRPSRCRLHAVLDAVPAAVALIAADSGRFSFLNRRAAALYRRDFLGTDLDTHLGASGRGYGHRQHPGGAAPA